MARVSRTAQRVAALRAQFERPHSPDGDPGVQAGLSRGMRPGPALRLRDHLLARTEFFDGAVLDALTRGVDQVVIVGAGYDDRAQRFRKPGVLFFELDHPATQADKQRRLRSIGAAMDDVVFVPADFRVHAVADVLLAAGHDAARPTLFVCEGLLVYLEPDDIVALLGGLAARAGASSMLAVSVAVHADGEDSAEVARAANRSRRRAGRREPWRTILPRSEHLALLHDAGWAEYEAVDDAELRPEARAGRSLLVLAHPA
jgi:methyltransferase (TIGR00027 family)